MWILVDLNEKKYATRVVYRPNSFSNRFEKTVFILNILVLVTTKLPPYSSLVLTMVYTRQLFYDNQFTYIVCLSNQEKIIFFCFSVSKSVKSEIMQKVQNVRLRFTLSIGSFQSISLK